MSLKLILGDITQASADAIVNAANPTLLGGGGVDGAIHRAAGPALVNACKALEKQETMRCPPGETRITESGNLNCRYVIHAVGPVYHSDPTPPATLAKAYQSSCKLALSHVCK